MVTVWLNMELDSPEFEASRLKLDRALKAALGDMDILFLSMLPCNSVKIQLHMPVHAMLLLYEFAIYTPGFLAGLTIKRLNALGRYISVVVQSSPTAEATAQTDGVPICRKSH